MIQYKGYFIWNIRIDTTFLKKWQRCRSRNISHHRLWRILSPVFRKRLRWITLYILSFISAIILIELNQVFIKPIWNLYFELIYSIEFAELYWNVILFRNSCSRNFMDSPKFVFQIFHKCCSNFLMKIMCQNSLKLYRNNHFIMIEFFLIYLDNNYSRSFSVFLPIFLEHRFHLIVLFIEVIRKLFDIFIP